MLSNGGGTRRIPGLAAAVIGLAAAVSWGLTGLIVRLYVDTPLGEAGCEPDVLPFLADRERQLIIGHDDLGYPVGLVEYPHLGDTCGRQGMPDELGRVLRVVDDVDLLAMQLGHDVPHPAAHRADARALRVDARLPGNNRDLGPVT